MNQSKPQSFGRVMLGFFLLAIGLLSIPLGFILFVIAGMSAGLAGPIGAVGGLVFLIGGFMFLLEFAYLVKPEFNKVIILTKIQIFLFLLSMILVFEAWLVSLTALILSSLLLMYCVGSKKMGE